MLRRITLAILSTYWRLTRGATLGAQGVVIDADNRVLLVRHGYHPGWHFPGGGIEWRETALDALHRELKEEAGVIVEGAPKLHGFFANIHVLPSDHIALFIVKEWTRGEIPKPNYEIKESRFFARSEWPDDISAGTKRRLAEIFDNTPITPLW